MALEPAFWAQFPGNFSYIPRRGMIASRNFASLASLHNFARGKAEGNHWGQAVTVLETTAAGPYHFNFHHGDLGNFTVIGPSGSGKTVVLNFLLAQARKYDPRIIFFDKDRGAELFLRAIGGRYDVLRTGEPSGLNPLLLDDTRREPPVPAVVAEPAGDRARAHAGGGGPRAAQGRGRRQHGRAGRLPPARAFQPVAPRRPAPAYRRPVLAAGAVVGRGRARVAVRQCRRPRRPVAAAWSGST